MHRAGGEVLPRECEQEIRRLRFADPGVERAFRHDYAEKSRAYLRVVMGVLLLLPTMTLIGGLVASAPIAGVSPPPAQRDYAVIWTFHVLGLLVGAGALALTWSRQFPRLFQPYMVLMGLFMGMTLMVRMLSVPDGIAPLLVGALVIYTLYRLRFVAAVLVYWTLIVFFLVYSHSVLHTPGSQLAIRLGLVLVANFMGMLAGYSLERSARRDFLLSRLLASEREKSERLLLNILPAPVAERLKEGPATVAKSFAEVSVLFADIVDFTPLAARFSADQVVELLNEVFSCFDRLAEKHGLEKIKTIGDAYMVVGGLPEQRDDDAEAIAAMALDMQREIARFQPTAGEPLRLRIGVNSGPVVAGVIGTRKFIYDLWGDTVNVAARMESQGLPGAIQVTEATYERLRHRYAFEQRPAVDVKGRGKMTTYLLVSARA